MMVQTQIYKSALKIYMTALKNNMIALKNDMIALIIIIGLHFIDYNLMSIETMTRTFADSYINFHRYYVPLTIYLDLSTSLNLMIHLTNLLYLHDYNLNNF